MDLNECSVLNCVPRNLNLHVSPVQLQQKSTELQRLRTETEAQQRELVKLRKVVRPSAVIDLDVP